MHQSGTNCPKGTHTTCQDPCLATLNYTNVIPEYLSQTSQSSKPYMVHVCDFYLVETEPDGIQVLLGSFPNQESCFSDFADLISFINHIAETRLQSSLVSVEFRCCCYMVLVPFINSQTLFIGPNKRWSWSRSN